MKVAVYAIAKNEEQFVERWATSAKDADVLLIADTGSTDGTVEKAKSLGIEVYEINVTPFRFDDARNTALALLPADIDYCIALDMDEVLAPGWKWELQKAYDKGLTRPGYRFINKVDSNGNPLSEFEGFRIHTRKNVRWKYPIHEIPMEYRIEEKKGKTKITITHLPDESKSRGMYLPLLEMAVEEDPNNPRHMYYLGREYFYHNRFKEAADMLLLYVNKSNFPAEKSYAYRILAKCEPEEAEAHLLRAIAEHESRESFLDLATFYYKEKRWEECLAVAMKSLEFTDKDTSFLSDANAWGHMPLDLVAVAAWNLGAYETAYEYGKQAVEITPNDERLQNNLKFYQEKINGDTK